MDDVALKSANDRLNAMRREIVDRRNAIAHAQGQISRLEGEIADLQAWVVQWYKLAGREVPADTIASPNVERKSSLAADRKRVRPKNPEREYVVEKALEVIRANGEPMPRRELYEALSAAGVEIKGKDPEMVLSTMLWRSKDRVRRLPTYGYWPTNERYPPFDDITYDL